MPGGPAPVVLYRKVERVKLSLEAHPEGREGRAVLVASGTPQPGGVWCVSFEAKEQRIVEVKDGNSEVIGALLCTIHSSLTALSLSKFSSKSMFWCVGDVSGLVGFKQ